MKHIVTYRDSDVKIAGWVVLAIGVLIVIFGLFMDVSVTTYGGYRFNNIGLMSQRQNLIIIGGFVAVAGLLFAIFSDRILTKTRKCPFCAEAINSDAIKCKHCGSDITAQTVAIEKNEPEDKSHDRLDGVNVKVIIGAVVIIFVVIVGYIMSYRS